jgi:Spherulation-specific family 4
LSRVTNHPGLTFIIVINPHSGPGAITGPDVNYTREIPRLNSYANVRTIGYVATGYAKRELALVLQDITTYSAWSKNATSGLGMQGIFFDETPSQYEPSIAQFLDTAHAAVRSAAGFGSQGMVSFFSFLGVAYLREGEGMGAQLWKMRQYESKWIWESKRVFWTSARFSLPACFPPGAGGRMAPKITKTEQCERSGWEFWSCAGLHHVVARTSPNEYFKSLHGFSATRLQFPRLNPKTKDEIGDQQPWNHS